MSPTFVKHSTYILLQLKYHRVSLESNDEIDLLAAERFGYRVPLSLTNLTSAILSIDRACFCLELVRSPSINHR